MPVQAFDATKTVFARKSFAVFTPTGGSATTVVGKIIDADGKTTIVDRKIPDAAGINRADIHFASEAEESVTFVDIEEIDVVLAIMGGLTGMVRGSVQVFVVDPRDAANKVRYFSDAFPCALMRDGAVKMGDGNPAKNPALKFMSEKVGAITWTPNGTTA